MSTTPFLLCLCLWVTPPAADPPALSISGNPTVREHRIVRLTAANVPEGAALIWDVSDESLVDAEERGNTFLFTAPPGNYQVKLRAITFGATRVVTVARLLVTVEVAARPPPTPGPKPPTPGPKPPAPPVNTPTKLTVVVVEETADAVATRGALFSDPALNARMKERGHGFRVVDKDVVGPDGKPPADIKRFLDRASGKALPQLFLVDEQGKARFAGDMAKTAAELLDLLTKFGG